MVIELQLLSGEWATFNLTGNFVLIERKHQMRAGERKDICILDDGVHNNGGGELMDSYDDVKRRLFEQ